MKTIRQTTDMFQEKPENGKKRSWIRLCILVLLLGMAAVMLFWPAGHQMFAGKDHPSFPSDTPAVTPAPTLPPESLSARQMREMAYEKDLAKLEQLTQDETLQEETRQQAARQMTRMIQQHQMELGVEEVLTNAGFAPCLVLMQNDALTVAVSASEVTASQSAVILSICLAHTEVPAENIRIMPGVV